MKMLVSDELIENIQQQSIMKQPVRTALYKTSFNPQKLRNTIKKVVRISITQIIIIEHVCQNNPILLFF